MLMMGCKRDCGCVVDIGGRVKSRSGAQKMKSRRRSSRWTGTMRSLMYQNRSDNESEGVNEGGGAPWEESSVVGRMILC